MTDIASITFKADSTDIKTATSDLDKLVKTSQNVDGQLKKTKKATDDFTQTTAKTAAATKGMGINMSSLSYQIQDVAVQLQGGQNALLVFGQQGSQIASAFGPGGIVIGALLAVGAAISNVFIGSLKEAEEEMKGFQDRIDSVVKSLDSFKIRTLDSDINKQVDAISLLRMEYGQLADKIDVLNRSFDNGNDAAGEKIKAATARMIEIGNDIKLQEEALTKLSGDRAELLQGDSKFNEIQDLTKKYEEYAKTLNYTGRELALYRLETIETAEADQAAIEDARERINVAHDKIEAAEKLLESERKLAAAAREAEAEEKKIAAERARDIDQIERMTERLDPLEGATRKYIRALELLERANENADVSDKKRLELIRLLGIEYQRAKESIINADLDKAMEDVDIFGGGPGGKSKVVDSFSDSLSQVWVSFIKDGEDAADQIAGIFQNFALNSLNKSLFEPFFGQLSNALDPKSGQTIGGALTSTQGLTALGGLGGTIGGQFAGGGGQTAGIGSSLGTLGAAALGFGPVGLIIGGLIGGIAGGLFDKDPKEAKIQLQSSTNPTVDEFGNRVVTIGNVSQDFENNVVGQSKFGTVGFSDKSRGIDADLDSLTKAFVGFDNAIAEFLNKDEIGAARDALADFRSDRREYSESDFFELLKDRVDLVSDALGNSMGSALGLLANAADGFDDFNQSLQDFSVLAPQLSVLFGASAEETAALLTGTSSSFQNKFIDALVSRNGNAGQFGVDVANQTLADVSARTGITFEQSVEFIENWQNGLINVNTVGADLIKTYQQVFIAGQAASDAQRELADAQKAQADQANAIATQQIKNATDAAFGALTDVINRDKSELQAAFRKELGGIDELFDLQRENAGNKAAEQIALFNSELDIAKTRIAGVNAVFRQLNSAISAIDSSTNTLGKRQSAQASIQDAIRFAQSGGSLAGRDFSSELSSLTNSSSQFFGTSVDFARDQIKTQIALKTLSGLTEDQLTDAEKTVELLESQIQAEKDNLDALIKTLDFNQEQAETLAENQHTASIGRLDNILSETKTQIEVLRGMDGTLDNISAALSATIGAAHNEGLTGPRNTTLYSNSQIQDFANDRLKNGDPMAIYDAAKAVGLSPAALDKVMGWPMGFSEGWIETQGLPKFANGGDHMGGFRMVGEVGPEMEFTGPSRIVSSSETRRLFNFDAMTKELKELKQDAKESSYAIAKNTQRFAKLMERWDVDGLPAERSV